MIDFVKRAVVDRIGGKRPSPVRAVAAAAVVGGVAAGVTYKALRR
jgi:hypothetical protein